MMLICIQGGLGACVSKQDVLAETQDDLMYLQGEFCIIIIIIIVMNDLYLYINTTRWKDHCVKIH